RDQHRVDVIAVEDAAIVADDRDLGERAVGRLEAHQLLLIDLATDGELAVLVARQGIEHAGRTGAHADDTHTHPVVGALPAEQRPGGGYRQGGRARLQELASRAHELSPSVPDVPEGQNPRRWPQIFEN